MQRFRATALLTFALLALVLTACDSGADSGSPDEGEAGGFGGPLRVMNTVQYDPTQIGADAANELGIYEEMGLEVEVVTGEDPAQAVATGDFDIGIGGPTRFTGAILQGLEATIVGPTTTTFAFSMIGPPDGPDSIEEMDGGRFGVSTFNSSSHYATIEVANSLGWDESQYEIIEVGDGNGRVAALESGAIDAFAHGVDVALSMEAEGIGKPIAFIGDYLGPNPLNVIIVADSVIDERPEAVRAFCEGYYEATSVLQDDPERAIQIAVDEWDWEEGDVTTESWETLLPHAATSDELTDEMLDNLAAATVFTTEGVDELSGDDMKNMYTPCSSL